MLAVDLCDYADINHKLIGGVRGGMDKFQHPELLSFQGTSRKLAKMEATFRAVHARIQKRRRGRRDHIRYISPRGRSRSTRNTQYVHLETDGDEKKVTKK